MDRSRVVIAGLASGCRTVAERIRDVWIWEVGQDARPGPGAELRSVRRSRGRGDRLAPPQDEQAAVEPFVDLDTGPGQRPPSADRPELQDVAAEVLVYSVEELAVDVAGVCRAIANEVAAIDDRWDLRVAVARVALAFRISADVVVEDDRV